MHFERQRRWLFPRGGQFSEPHPSPRHAIASLISMIALAPALLQSAALSQGVHSLPLQLGAPVVGRPISGTRILDYKPAADSTDPVAVHAEEIFFRDSEGRTRSEIKYPGRLPTIDIIDFVAHIHYHWTVGDSVVSRADFPEVAPQSKAAENLNADAPLIEGVPTRHSHSVIGKSTIEKSVESWYSPDFSLAMLTIIDQPGIGKTTYRFVNVIRAEPDAALFRVPKGFAIEDSKMTPPSPVNADEGTSSPEKVAPDKRSLPHPIKDDNYLAALARFHAAVPRWLPGSYHGHTDVRMIDLYGKESSATVDHWQKGRLSRVEEQAAGFHFTTVWGETQNWSTHEGDTPLRLINLSDLTPRPGPTERRIRIYAKGYVEMKRRIVDGTIRSCSGEYAGAELCFDVSTGFPISATVDDEEVVYEQWAQFGGATYPSRLALYRGHRLQMEATTTITPLDDSNDARFQPLPGVEPSPNSSGADREDQHEIVSWGRMNSHSYGEALVKVYVDRSGRVKRAELLDADDKSLVSAAIAAAKRTVYMPQETDGQNVPFETTFWTSHWSTVDPRAVVATSRESQGTD